MGQTDNTIGTEVIRSEQDSFEIDQEVRRLLIFLASAYGMVVVMLIPMLIGLRNQRDLSVFVNTQMMYPACGVILGRLLVRRNGEKLPMIGYGAVLLTTLAMIVISVGSLFVDLGSMDLGAAGSIDWWDFISQMMLTAGSILALIGFVICGKEKAENAGMRSRKIGLSIGMIALFLVLYFGRILIITGISGARSGAGIDQGILSLLELSKSPAAWGSLVSLSISFFAAWIAFFGEEYGWRYYLQPILQERFGLRGGVLMLGILWAIWHMNVDYMYYSVENGPVMFLTQIVTCIALAVFLGYAYMKTQNIWVPIIMHFLNNNLVVVLSGGRVDVLQNQQVSLAGIPLHMAGAIVFVIFLLAPIYAKRPVKSDADEWNAEAGIADTGHVI